jgi:hypothetical protein
VYEASNTFAYFVPSWNVTDFDAAIDRERLPAARARIAGRDGDDLRPVRDVEVATEARVAHVVIDAVRAGDPALGRANGRVGDHHLHVGMMRPDVAARHRRARREVVFRVEPHRARPERGLERDDVDLAISGDERKPELAVDVECDALEERVASDTQELRDAVDPRPPGRVDLGHRRVG